MNKLLRRLIIFLFVTTFCNLNYSQNQNGNKQLLASVIETLETLHQVKFSYEPKTIEGITITDFEFNTTLKVALAELETQTTLTFKILNTRFITITKATRNYVQQLDEVVINNYLTKGISKVIDGAVEVSNANYDILPGLIEPDVLQIAQRLPGIYSIDERISNLNIRGGTNDQNLILYEGIRMYQSGHFFGLISAFNPYLTERINVSKNGTSARYGDAVSGVISIENANEITKNKTGGLGTNLLAADGFAKIPLSKKVELQLSARRGLTDAYSSPTYNAYFKRIFRDSELSTSNTNTTLVDEQENFRFYDLSAKLIYAINKSSRVKVNFLNIYNTLNYERAVDNGSDLLEESKNELKQMSYAASIAYSKVWKNDIETSAQLYISYYDLDAVSNAITNNQRINQENKVEDYGLRLEASKVFTTNFKASTGYQLNEVGVTNLEDISNPNFTRLSKQIIRTHALFSEAEWYSSSKKTYIKFGLRGNYFEKFSGFTIEPRLNMNQKLSKTLRLEILGELKSQSLTQVIDLQQDFFGIEKRRWQLANEEDIPIMTSQQIAVGLNYSKNNLLVAAEAYYKNVNDVNAKSQGFQNQFQRTTATGFYTIKGLDVLINKRFQNFSTWLSYSYSKNNFTFYNLNNGISFANSLDLRHIANASVTYNHKNLKIGLGVNWNSGRPYTEPSENQINNNLDIEYSSPNVERLNDYVRTDMSAIYDFKISKYDAQIAVSLWNIFNTKNIINRYYTEDSNNTITEVDNEAIGFTPNFSFRVGF